MKSIKDRVQFCRNTQPIPGQIYPTETTKPAEWYIGRPDSDYRFRYFMNEVHVREILSCIPPELMDDQAQLEGLKERIRDEIKAEYEAEIERLTKLADSYLQETSFFSRFDDPEDEDDEVPKSGMELLVKEADKIPQKQVYRCLETGKDFSTEEELQIHQLELAKSSTTAPAKRLTAQERLALRSDRE